jgi:hypothetical protein
MALISSLLVAAAAPQGCGTLQTVKRQTVTPENIRKIPHERPFLKAHLKDGSVCVLSRWSVTVGDTAVEGDGERLDLDRNRAFSGHMSVPMDSVALFESNIVQSSPALAAYTVLLAGTAIGTILCITNPKACFGSCPTFYWEDGPSNVVQAEAFSSSVAPCLEATDVDALYHVNPSGDALRLRVTNEAYETHVIRRAEVLAAPRPPDGRVTRDKTGAFWQIRGLETPRAATAPEGDCTRSLSSFDGIERFSAADSADLAARETIDLEFASSGTAPAGLVIAARQTLVTTYLYYQTLAFLGRSAASWMANLERRAATLLPLAGGLGRELGGMEVSVLDSAGRWVPAGEVGETGPIATDVYLIRLPTVTAPTTRVRLRMARGAWRLDYAALGRVGERVQPIRLSPARVTRDGAEDEVARQALTAGPKPLVTSPGDAFGIEYRLPPSPERYEYFLEARGYYLEWMRDAWLKEENAARARQIFAGPRGALRALAPEFKAAEPHMESLFWASRYVKPE